MPRNHTCQAPGRRDLEVAAAARGYSLMELLVVLALAAATAMLGLPYVRGLTAKHRVSDTARQVENTLQYARMRAISERANYVVSFANNRALTFIDTNGNAVRDGGEKSPYPPVPFPANVRYAYPTNTPSQEQAESLAVQGCRCLQYQPSGYVANALTGKDTRALAIGDGKEFRRITVSLAGALSVAKWDAASNQWK
jgi:prepilin-type N-terminal cleavage/methylation domain-containing protein